MLEMELASVATIPVEKKQHLESSALKWSSKFNSAASVWTGANTKSIL